MTIKDFSLLCGCTAKTLRYYDSIGLLKPVRVDERSGYRHYDKAQAASFVRIKNLQRAGFTIEEIKALLDKDDRAVYDAFAEKIRMAEEKLLEIQAIRESYRTEMNELQRKVESIKQRISDDMRGYDPTEEFGISAERYEGIIESTLSAFDGMDPALIRDIDYEAYHEGEAQNEHGEEPPHDYAGDIEYELIYEKHGFEKASEFMPELEPAAAGGEYAFLFELTEEKYPSSTAFMNTLLGILLSKRAESDSAADAESDSAADAESDRAPRAVSLYCNTERSKDGKNHLRVFKRRA